jgi:tetratricopeptide (TPR) repeat protein
MLADHGVDGIDDGLLDAVHRVTGGNPLFVRRIASLGPSGPCAPLPDGIRMAVLEAVDRLSPEAQHILRTSSVLGLHPSVRDAAAVACVAPTAVLAALVEAIPAGLVEPGSDRVAFTHDVVRSVLEQSLDPVERLESHARAIGAVAPDPTSASASRLSRRARHALAVAPRAAKDAAVAVAACQDAAAALVPALAYEQADALLSAAVDLYESGELGVPPAPLVSRWAQAALRCGRLGEARERFALAAEVARAEGDALLSAEAALGLGGHWLYEHRSVIDRARVLAMQRQALAALDDDQAGLRCRLQARMAAEAVYDGGSVRPVLEALDAARTCGDPRALAEVLSLTHHALLGPEHLELRRRLASEMVSVAARTDVGVLALIGMCWLVVDLFHAGDPGAVRALADLRERADALGCQNVLYIVGVMEAMLLIRAGRLAEAEEAADRCFELGVGVGEADTLGYYSAQLFVIRWLQGRHGELLHAARDVVDSPTLVPLDFSLRAASLLVAVQEGQREHAAEGLAAMAADGLAALPRSSTWTAGMVALVELAAELGDAVVAREAYELLAPFADRPVVPSLGVVCIGSTERSLGVAAATFGDVDAAVRHLDAAVAANGRLGHRPMTAVARAEAALARCRRDAPGDRERATAMLEVAVAEGDELGLDARVAEWRRALGELASTRRARPELGDPGDGGRPATGVIRREARGWVIDAPGRRVHVADRIGMRYLAELLTHPFDPIPALVLAGSTSMGDAGGSRQEVHDAKARRAYLARIRALGDELAEAEAGNDLARADLARLELEVLLEQVGSATGLGGRPRAFADDAERARTAVTKAIKRAIEEIALDDAELGDHLRASISTGTACVYRPEAIELRWSSGAPLSSG